MANSFDDTKTGKRVPSNNQRNIKKKKQHQNNLAQKVNQGGEVNAPIRNTVSMSAHDVEVTRDAVREQELKEQGSSEINVIKVVEVEDVKTSATEDEKVADISDILVKSSDTQVEYTYGAAVNDVTSISADHDEKPELVVIKNDDVKNEVSNSEQEEDTKVVSIKSDEASKEETKEETPQAEQFKPVFVDDEAQSSGSWLSRLFLLAVLALCCFTVVHFLKSGLIKQDENKISEHSDVYAYDIDEDQTNNDEKNSVAKDALVAAENKLVQDDIEADIAKTGADSDEDENIKSVKSGLMKGIRRSSNVLPSESVSSLIAKKSVDSGISPVLITAVVIAESSFNPKATSYSGKRGLMQISPERERLIRELRGTKEKPGDLYDPEYNLDLGIWYLKHLMNKYDGNMSKALMAYSWSEETLEKVTSGEMRMPRWAGPYYANIQQYYNAIIGDDGQKLVLSLPKVEETAPAKTNSIQVMDVSSKTEEKEAWEKAVLKIGKHVSPQTKSEIISVIKEQSLLYDMDPAYISAIIMAESAFDPLSTSDYGKRGLFQMQPKWARIIADTLGVTWQGEDALFEPEYNIEIAVAYLQHLKLLFDDDLEKVAIAFNLTPYRVSRILAGKRKLPQNIELYINKIRDNCKDYSCKSEISKSYLERLKKAQAK